MGRSLSDLAMTGRRRTLARVSQAMVTVLALSGCQLSNAAQMVGKEICRGTVATLPAVLSPDFRHTDQMQRFEVRDCGGGVQILAFEQGASKPAIAVDVDGWPRLLHHVSSVLVVQTVGGSSSAVFVFHFRNGKVQPPLAAATRGIATISAVGSGRKLLIRVPPDRRVTSSGKISTFRVPVELELARP